MPGATGQRRRDAVCRPARTGALALHRGATRGAPGPKRYNRARLDSYECGIQPVSDPGRNARTIPVRYYTVAMTFIIFDVEIMFLVPWAVHFDQLGSFGYLAVMLFILNLSLAYAYEWRRGGLDWD
ncbi:NAD(P)H-quinone oxidoreductase subunit 3 [Nocardioides sp. zg-1230]|nr:NAD(P)H-quinone oxidoreductase subunit 3 [Nocardioides sp. zg-1230]